MKEALQAPGADPGRANHVCLTHIFHSDLGGFASSSGEGPGQSTLESMTGVSSRLWLEP